MFFMLQPVVRLSNFSRVCLISSRKRAALLEILVADSLLQLLLEAVEFFPGSPCACCNGCGTLRHVWFLCALT